MRFLRWILPLIFLILLVWSIIQIPPPKSLVEASFSQVFYFFIPLLLFFSTLLNVFYKNILKSGILGFGLTLLIFLRGLGALNLVTGTFTVISTILLAKSLKNSSIRFPKNKLSHRKTRAKIELPTKSRSSFKRLRREQPKLKRLRS